MIEADSRDLSDPARLTADRSSRVARRRQTGPSLAQTLPEIQPFPHWARLSGAAGGAESAMFFAGAGIAPLDMVLRTGEDGAEPPFSGVLRQRLALKAAATSVRLARLREDEAALRDAEHLGVSGETSPAGRVHRLWRLFATRSARHDAHVIRAAADCLELPPHIDGALAALLQEASTRENPLNAAAHVSAAALQSMSDAPQIDAEIFALWLADLVLARRLAWAAPLPLLATVVTHPSLRTASNRRPRSSDPDWSVSVARAAARAAQEAYALAGELSRRSETLLSVAPKLRAKKAACVVALLLNDDCVSASRAAKAAGLSDRAGRRLFNRLVALGAVRELSGRANFRLYGL